ncbi:MAG TPA: prolyl oligopeptidase family serine peptidase [Streptosporangiaceae bacterium]|nr:prolyl oligopeptidase family serine peptidase [Streptosporangiaceae bacterium]
MTPDSSFPRQQARTQFFTLGIPNSFAITPDGEQIAFLRGRSGTDLDTCLWVRDTKTGDERLVADPRELLAGSTDEIPDEERARRERTRQAAAGVVSFATDDAVTLAAFALSGRLFTADLRAEPAAPEHAGPGVRVLATPKPVIDPRPDPTGTHIAYVADGALRVIAAGGSSDRPLAVPEAENVTYGLAEFVAAEEMSRTRGFWWAPDGQHLLVARVDTSPVVRWHISDPANPARPPVVVAYPAAGTPNADVSVVIAGLDGSLVPVDWDSAALPYLISVHWSAGRPALLRVCSRDQRTMRVLTVGDDGKTETICEDTDPDWVDVVVGTPAWTRDGRLVRVTARDGAYRLLIGDEPVTPATLNVAEVLDAGDDVLFTAKAENPAELHVYSAGGPGGVVRLTGEPGTHTAARGGGVLVTSSRSLDWFGPRVLVQRGGEQVGEISSLAETPILTPEVTFFTAGPHEIRCALVLPRGHRPGSARLPVLCDPYGGPAGQRVLSSRNMYLTSQWFADQGFAVLIADGRGTPGRGPDWDRLIHYDEATPNVEDQVAALQAAAAANPDLDLSRVGIRGWSHGGYLAALAVLRRPDVFHAAVAGAPVTDLRLYDTFYNERYLGHPDEHPEAYAHNSLIDDAPKLERPLMLIHGLADDNVVVAHTLRLSTALLAAGRPHTVLPLSGVTHMARQEDVAANLDLLQVEFLRGALGMDSA